MAQRQIMTFAEYRAMQEQQAQAMPEVEQTNAVQKDAVQDNEGQKDAVQDNEGQKGEGQNIAGQAVQNNAAPGARKVLSFAQIAARQSMPLPAPAPAPQPAAQQQTQSAQQPAQPAHPAYAANPYLNPNIEMPEPEPFDVTNLKYAAHTPADPLEHASHISGRRDTAYDRVYM